MSLDINCEVKHFSMITAFEVVSSKFMLAYNANLYMQIN